MSELDDAIARLDLAVARLEAAPRLNQPAVALESARLATDLARQSATEDERLQQLAAAIVTRVEAALGKIGQALGEEC